MASLKQATQPRDTSNMTLVTGPAANPRFPSAPTSADPEFSPLALAPIPPVLGTETDAQRQFYRIGVSQLRMPPLPASASLASGAAASSQTEVITESIVTGKLGSLVMPSIFSVGGDSPFTAQGQPIEVALIDEDASTFLAGPAISTGSSPILDVVTSTVVNSPVSTISVGPLSPSNDGDFALFAVSPGFDGTAGPVGWTMESTTNLNTMGYIYHLTLSDTTPITVSQTYSDSEERAGILAFFSCPSGNPIIANTTKFNSGSTGLHNITIPSTTAGNTLIVIALYGQGSGPATTFSTPTDSTGDNFISIASVGSTDNSKTVAIWAASNIVGGATTLSVTYGVAGGGAICVYEVSNLLPSAGAPRFRAIVNTDLDGAVFGAAGSSHNAGAVPDPGGTAHTPPDYLGDDAGFHAITPMTTLGDTVYEDATPIPVRLAGNITTTKKFYTQTGTGSVSAAPVWTTLVSSDLPASIVMSDAGGIHSDTVALTGQTSSISGTNLVASPTTTSLYQISYYLADTTPGTSGTVSVAFTWNDGGSQTVTSANVTFGTHQFASGTLVVKCTSGAIQYLTTVTSPIGSPQYSLDIRVLPLG